MRVPTFTCTFLAAFALSGGAIAADWPGAVDAAWQRLPASRAAEARGELAEARRQAADSWLPAPPTLTIGERSDRYNRDTGAREYETELGLPLWLPGQREAHRQAAAGDAGEQRAQLAALRLALAGELRELAWSLREAEAGLAQANIRLDTARRLADDVERRVRAGDLARVDLNLAHSERAEAAADAAQADLALGELQNRWLTLTGMPQLPAPLLESVPAGAPPAADEHPALRQRSAAVEAARAQLAVVRETTREAPEFAIRGRRERDAAGEAYAGSVGFALKIPFASEARNAPRLAEANGRLIGAEAELAAERRRLHGESAQQRAALATAERRRALAEEAQQSAADNLRLYEKSFALGELDLATLLRARAAAHKAETFALRSAADYGRAVARLKQNLGILP